MEIRVPLSQKNVKARPATSAKDFELLWGGCGWQDGCCDDLGDLAAHIKI